jgi:hypothetical protein
MLSWLRTGPIPACPILVAAYVTLVSLCLIQTFRFYDDDDARPFRNTFHPATASLRGDTSPRKVQKETMHRSL